MAVTAAVTASSERAPDQAAVRVVDNMVSGFPAVRANAEWVTVAQGAGAWIQLGLAVGADRQSHPSLRSPNADDQS